MTLSLLDGSMPVPGTGTWAVARMSKSYEPAPDALVVDSGNPVGQLIKRAVEFVGHGSG